LGLRARVVEKALDLAAHRLEVGAEVFEHVGCDALTLDEKTEEQVLGAHVVVTHAPRLFEGDLDDLLDARRGDDLLDDDPLVAAEHGLDRLTDLADFPGKVVQDLGGETLTSAEKPQEQMLCPDVAVM